MCIVWCGAWLITYLSCEAQQHHKSIIEVRSVRVLLAVPGSTYYVGQAAMYLVALHIIFFFRCQQLTAAASKKSVGAPNSCLRIIYEKPANFGYMAHPCFEVLLG